VQKTGKLVGFCPDGLFSNPAQYNFRIDTYSQYILVSDSKTNKLRLHQQGASS
jgi:hypothetical protein